MDSHIQRITKRFNLIIIGRITPKTPSQCIRLVDHLRPSFGYSVCVDLDIEVEVGFSYNAKVQPFYELLSAGLASWKAA